MANTKHTKERFPAASIREKGKPNASAKAQLSSFVKM